jgi:iron complex outermembrane receptor protein
MQVKHTPIASAVALMLMSAAFAQAQQTAPAPTPPAAEEKKEEKKEAEPQQVTITGIRASLQQSLNQKRQADSRVEVITAEDIGKMPDKNVADSLQRVPGVTISSAGANEGGFDEKDRVSMRGTNPSLTQTLINGHGVASGDWFILNQVGTVGRSVSYSLLPSELVERVVVHKSSQASLVEGGLTGSVDIVTRKPLGFRKSLTLEASVGAVYADLPGKTDPQLSMLANWKNDANTLGVLLQAFHEKRSLRRDGQEILSYQQIDPASTIATSNPDLAGVFYPGLIGSALFEQVRKREGGLIEVQLKPTNDLTLGVSAFTSELNASNYNRNYLLWGSSILAGGAGQAPAPGYVVRNGTLVSATFPGVAGRQYGVYDQISRPNAGSSSNFITFDGSWRANDALSVSTQFGTSRGTSKTPTQDVAEWNTGVGSGAAWTLHGLGSAADWNLGTQSSATPIDPVTGHVPLGWIFGHQNVNTKDKETWGRLDAEYAIDKGVLSTLKFGLRQAEHTRDSGTFTAQGPACKDASGNTVPFDWSQQFFCPVGAQSPFDPANFPSGFSNYPSDFADGIGGNFPRDVWFYSPAQLADFNARFTNRDPVERRDWSAEYFVNEKSTAGYAQANLEGSGWSGNVGLRLVRTKQRVVSNVGVDPTTPGAITTSAFGAFLPVTTEHTHNDALPSANVKFDLTKSLVARFAASRTMARPDYSALAGAVTLNQTALSGTSGNPDLKPVRSNNFDASLEWYFAPRSLLSAGLYYMDLKNFISYGTVRRSFLIFDQQNPQGVMREFVLTLPVNTTGKVKGLELAYEQPLFTNFGVSANYTYTDAKEAGGGPLVGASKHTYNLVGYYEDDRFNVRVAYNFRDKFFSGLDRSTAFSQDSVATLAASVGYRISDQLSISLEGQNLNNPTLKYYAQNEDQPRAFYKNGRQYYVTLRGKF